MYVWARLGRFLDVGIAVYADQRTVAGLSLHESRDRSFAIRVSSMNPCRNGTR